MRNERGIALIMVILFTAFLSAIGLGVLLAVFVDRLATGNMNGSVAMLYAADAGIELAARDLAQEPDWDAVLAGSRQGSFTDGPAGGARPLPGGGNVDLTAATNMLNCGKSSNCTAAQLSTSSHERPWGQQSRWRDAYGLDMAAPRPFCGWRHFAGYGSRDDWARTGWRPGVRCIDESWPRNVGPQKRSAPEDRDG